MKLYTYFRSSCSYRVRIALGLKGLEVEQIPVMLLDGDHRRQEYLRLNPQGFVPALVDGETVIAQSLAILEYLEERFPQPPLLPADPVGRARVRQLSLIIAADTQPLQNVSVGRYAQELGGGDDELFARWNRRWIQRGLEAFERALADSEATGAYCHGEKPGMADCCLVPQVYNARRFECDLEPLPTVVRIDAACREMEAFARAAPERQPEAGA